MILDEKLYLVLTKISFFRACIGQRFARLELYSLIIKLVQNFKMEDATSGEVGVFTRFVSVPNKQINIKFIKR